MPTWARIADQEQYEAGVLRGSAVPSVVITSPNPDLSQAEADLAKASWMAKHTGPTREPAVFPAGTKIETLAWSPQDQQLNETRKLSLTEVANIANMDGYWLGASTTGYSYKSPGPMYLNLVRQTIGPILVQLEQAWGPVWLPSGQELKADRQAILGDDMGTTIAWLGDAVDKGLMTNEEARAYLGKSPLPPRDGASAELGDLQVKAEILGQLIRAGVDPESAARFLGLSGLSFLPGMMPVTVKPTTEA